MKESERVKTSNEKKTTSCSLILHYTIAPSKSGKENTDNISSNKLTEDAPYNFQLVEL